MKKAFSGILLLISISFISSSFVSAQTMCSAPDLCVGSSGEDVKNLQVFLNKQGYLELFDGVASGIFGGFTEAAVQNFQSAKRLPVTGIVTCATRDAINASVSSGEQAIARCPSSRTSATETGGTAKSALDDWYDNNCKPEPIGLEYGRITPLLYTPSGMGGTELAQINKPFTVGITGIPSTTIGAKVTASDNQVNIQSSICVNGLPSGGGGCTVTVSGEPRDVYIKVFNEGAGIKPVCRKVQVYRAPVTYNIGLSIVNNQLSFGSGETFKVTLDGITRAKVAQTFVNGNPFTISPNNGVVFCGLLPAVGNSTVPEYLCSASGLDINNPARYPNRIGPVTYTLTVQDSRDTLDIYRASGAPKTIQLLKHGETSGNAVSATCPKTADGEAQGVDPRYPQQGCTRCANIPNVYRSQVASCAGSSQDTYSWVNVRAATLFDRDPDCSQVRPLFTGEGNACLATQESVSCKQGGRVYICQSSRTTNVENASYHGKVFNASNGNPLSGVSVRPTHPTASWLGVTCPVSVTDEQGNYSFTREQSGGFRWLCFRGWVNLTKQGFVDSRVDVGDEFDRRIADARMVPTAGGATGGQLSINGGSEQTKQINFPGSAITFIINNAREGEVEACSQSARFGQLLPSVSACSWSSVGWSAGNPNWSFDQTNNLLIGTFNPSNTETTAWLNDNGLRVRSSFRKTSDPGRVVSAVINVVSTRGAGGADGINLVKTGELSFRLENGKRALTRAQGGSGPGLDVCYVVTKRNQDRFTPNDICIDATPSNCTWSAWNPGEEWTRSGDDLIWSANPADFAIPGLEVMIGFRKTGTTNVTMSTIHIEGGNDPCR